MSASLLNVYTLYLFYVSAMVHQVMHNRLPGETIKMQEMLEDYATLGILTARFHDTHSFSTCAQYTHRVRVVNTRGGRKQWFVARVLSRGR